MQKPLEISEGFNTRATLFSCEDTGTYVGVATHHIVTDLFSSVALVHQINHYYENGFALAHNSESYGEMAWELHKNQRVSEEALLYWKTLLSGSSLHVRVPVHADVPCIGSQVPGGTMISNFPTNFSSLLSSIVTRTR